MANFESLIRGAMAQHDAADEGVRARIYQSSRNALQRMIASNRSLTVENALNQQRALEDAISRIEAEATPAGEAPPATPAIHHEPGLKSSPHPEAPPQQDKSPTIAVDPAVDPAVRFDKPVLDPVSDYPEPQTDLPPEFSRRRRGQRKFFKLIVAILVLGLIAWASYWLFSEFIDGKFFNGGNDNGLATTLDPNAQQLDDSDYILILEPGDPSSLVAAGRGSAEIVSQLGTQMLRIVSLRDKNNRQQAAKPVLLKINPGVLEQIAGKQITVEIYAKSGSAGPVAFSVECMFENQADCGRKRFRIGLQPEASIFSVTVPDNISAVSNAFFAIRTDITSSAGITGEGDAVDIIYVRLRIRF